MLAHLFFCVSFSAGVAPPLSTRDVLLCESRAVRAQAAGDKQEAVRQWGIALAEEERVLAVGKRLRRLCWGSAMNRGITRSEMRVAAFRANLAGLRGDTTSLRSELEKAMRLGGKLLAEYRRNRRTAGILKPSTEEEQLTDALDDLRRRREAAAVRHPAAAKARQ